MKTTRFISTLALIVVTMFTACQNDNELVSTPIDPSTSVDSNEGANGTSPMMKASSSLTEYEISPTSGKPNSTTYLFKVYDLSGKFGISVKLYEKATGNTTYYSMIRVGNYWTFSTKISRNGWYDYRYVYSVSKSNISSNSYTVCNTYNTFNPYDISTITWPFGADGSSWTKRYTIVNKVSQKWVGGEERKQTKESGGYGWNQVTHIGIDEQYSDDWNRGTGNEDFRLQVRSPLDGYIESISSYYVSGYGQSKFVSVIQECNGKKYRFYIAHLDSYESNISIGKFVRAGIDPIGYIGMSGANSAHAHCNMRNVTNNTRTSIKFEFNAK